VKRSMPQPGARSIFITGALCMQKVELTEGKGREDNSDKRAGKERKEPAGQNLGKKTFGHRGRRLSQLESEDHSPNSGR